MQTLHTRLGFSLKVLGQCCGLHDLHMNLLVNSPSASVPLYFVSSSLSPSSTYFAILCVVKAFLSVSELEVGIVLSLFLFLMRCLQPLPHFCSFILKKKTNGENWTFSTQMKAKKDEKLVSDPCLVYSTSMLCVCSCFYLETLS